MDGGCCHGVLCGGFLLLPFGGTSLEMAYGAAVFPGTRRAAPKD